jgi:thymidylate synthase (FAD)
MIITKSGFEIISHMPYEKMIEIVERAYRICYASDPKGDPEDFIKSKLKIGHETPIEHCSVSVEFTFDRGVSHELVRHRIAAYSQQSTRYCNYSKDKWSNQIRIIEPLFFDHLIWQREI